jgi:hypothetical protein
MLGFKDKAFFSFRKKNTGIFENYCPQYFTYYKFRTKTLSNVLYHGC